jgi:hypothetical protein
MGLVDDDREAPIPVLRADVVQDEREFLDRRDDDLFAVRDESSKIPECSAWPTVAPTSPRSRPDSRSRRDGTGLSAEGGCRRRATYRL